MSIHKYVFGKRGEDQRLWVEDGKVFVYDWSGDSPTTTDDGPLEVKPGTVCTLQLWSNSVDVSVPVYSHRRDEDDLYCTMSLRCFETLTTLVSNLKLGRGDKYATIALQVFKAEALALSLNKE